MCGCRFSGKAAQALLYAILKYEHQWSTTDRSVIHVLSCCHWTSKRSGPRADFVKAVEAILLEADTASFLECVDAFEWEVQDHMQDQTPAPQRLRTLMKRAKEILDLYGFSKAPHYQLARCLHPLFFCCLLHIQERHLWTSMILPSAF